MKKRRRKLWGKLRGIRKEGEELQGEGYGRLEDQ